MRTSTSAVYNQLSAYSTQKDAFSFNGNQASLAHINSMVAGIYSERRFFLQELSLYQFAAALPTGSGNFGVSASYFGSIQSNQAVIGLAYGRKLGEKVTVGAQFNYVTMQVASFDKSSAINFEGGLLLQITEQIQAGFHAYNPTSVTFSKNGEEKLPAIYKTGLGYQVSEIFFVAAEIEKIEDLPVGVNGGLQYSFNNLLFARSGFSSGSSVYYLGLGVQLAHFRLDATASVHPHLGITPGLMLVFKRQEKE